MTPFFLAGTAFSRATLSGLPHPAGSRPSPAHVPSRIAAGCLCFPPGQRATAPSNEPRPIDAAATPLNSFDKCPILAPRDLHGCQERHDFVASPVRNHDVLNQANDIVVEFGNARRRRRRVGSQRPGSMRIGLPGERMVYNRRIPTAPFRSLFP
jgi:hypothetical protein